MKSTATTKSTREALRIQIRRHFATLAQHQQAQNREAFNHLMKQILPGVRAYLSRKMARATRDGRLPKGKYTLDDFINELYLKAYDHIQRLKSGDELHTWLFEQADQLLEDVMVEEEFDHTFFENIDKYSQMEWAEMEEHFSTDGDGDLVMEEELDDPSYPKHDYTLADVFTEDQTDDLLEKLNRELSPDIIHRHIDFVLQRMPAALANIFDLAVNQQLTPQEIASIKRTTSEEVSRQLAEARRLIRFSFEKQFDQLKKQFDQFKKN